MTDEKTKVLITAAVGSALIGDTISLVVPEKLDGVGTWNRETRARITANLRSLHDELVEVSPIYKEETFRVFGPRDWYEQQVREIKGTKRELEADEAGQVIPYRYVLKPEHRLSKAVVELDVRQKKALLIVMLLRVHPGPIFLLGKPDQAMSFAATAGIQNEIYWPLADQLGVRVDLEKKTGADLGTDVDFKSDDEYKAAAKAESKKAPGPAPAEAAPAKA